MNTNELKCNTKFRVLSFLLLFHIVRDIRTQLFEKIVVIK